MGADPKFPRPEMRLADGLLARAGVARLHLVQTLRRIEAVIERLVAMGFLPIGFTAHAVDVPTVYVEVPEDRVIDALEGRFGVCGKFRRTGSTLWLSIDGVRVEWQIDVEPMPEAA